MNGHLPHSFSGSVGDPLARLREIETEVTAMSAQVSQELARQAATYDPSRERMQAAARRGELGPAWRVIQQRVDLGETTVEAVFTGEDHSPEAADLRRVSRDRLTELHRGWAGQPDDAEAPNPLREFSEQRMAHLARVADITHQPGGTTS